RLKELEGRLKDREEKLTLAVDQAEKREAEAKALTEKLAELRAQHEELAADHKVLTRLVNKGIQEQLRQGLVIQVLEISPNTGELSYYDPRTNKRRKIVGPADAARLIQENKQEAGKNREPYYLFLFPRPETQSDFPSTRQMQNYQRWFKGTAYG